MTFSHRMNIWIRSAISLGVSLFMAFAVTRPAVEDFETSISDYWFRLRGIRQAPSDVVLVAMDELSYVDLKIPLNQPWPRQIHAKLLERLAQYQVKQVVFDILFLDPGTDPDGDAQLAAAIAKVPTVLGTESSLKHMSGPTGGFTIEELLRPYEPLRKAAKGEGLIAAPTDGAYIRRFLVDKTERTKSVPSLAEAAASFSPGDGKPRPGPRDLINYYGPSGTIPNVSYYQVIQDEMPLPQATLQGKTIVVGLLLRTETGPAQKDDFLSPFAGERLFGVEMHATAALNLLHNDWIKRPSAAIEVLAQCILAGIFTFLGLTLTPGILVMLAAATAAIWIAAVYTFWNLGLFITGAFTIFGFLPALILASAVYFYFVASRSEKTIRSAFELYVSPEMVPKLGDQSKVLKLGGEKLWVTALFTDIQDFTSIAENMPAEKTSEMLNAYFTEVMDVIFLNQGTLLKFIGDAVFGLWGAPVKVPNHAELAIRTALAIQVEVERFNSSGRFPPLHTRIGIHTGPMLVGNLGSKRRFDYTAIGDSVNLASRVEGLNRNLGTKILFTEATKRDAGGSVNAVPIAASRVRGKRESVHLYTVFEPQLSPAHIERWNQALETFRQRSFTEAKGLFEALGKDEPQLRKTCNCYIEQCSLLDGIVLDVGWAGEVEFVGK